ncbi:MAG: hypothetical protein U0T69_05890 [Chitinophagales bacterium]
MQNLSTQAEAVIYYIQEMDIEMIDLILDKDKTYQEFPKREFIEKLGDAFDIMKLLHNEKLIGYPGFCGSDDCPNQCKNGYSFIGNTSNHKIDLLFEVKNGEIQDLFECSVFEILSKEKNTDFLRRVFIDRSNDPLMNDDGTWDPF